MSKEIELRQKFEKETGKTLFALGENEFELAYTEWLESKFKSLEAENKILETNVDDARSAQFTAEAENQKLETDLAHADGQSIAMLKKIEELEYQPCVKEKIKAMSQNYVLREHVQEIEAELAAVKGERDKLMLRITDLEMEALKGGRNHEKN